MTRYYGDLRCPICRRDPDLGYTYLCSQDEKEKSWDPLTWQRHAVDAATHEHASDRDDNNANGPTPKLSSWIERGIADGHYTQEQISILRAQRQKVVNSITASYDQLNGGECSDHAHRTNTSPSVDSKSNLPFPVINQVSASPFATDAKIETRLFPYCEFHACQTCRPTFRDRAWSSFDDAFADTSVPVIDFVNDNRPLSSPYIIAAIDLRARPLLRTFDSFSLDQPVLPAKRPLMTATARYRPSYPRSNDIADQRIEPESKGFKDSVRRVFRGLLLPRSDSVSSKSSNRSSRVMSRKMRVREEDSSEDRGEFDMRLWKQFNEELLRTASNTKLPGHDGMDGLEAQSQEVEVGNGVAVMEESVDIGTADVIMAV